MAKLVRFALGDDFVPAPVATVVEDEPWLPPPVAARGVSALLWWETPDYPLQPSSTGAGDLPAVIARPPSRFIHFAADSDFVPAPGAPTTALDEGAAWQLLTAWAKTTVAPVWDDQVIVPQPAPPIVEDDPWHRLESPQYSPNGIIWALEEDIVPQPRTLDDSGWLPSWIRPVTATAHPNFEQDEVPLPPLPLPIDELYLVSWLPIQPSATGFLQSQYFARSAGNEDATELVVPPVINLGNQEGGFGGGRHKGWDGRSRKKELEEFLDQAFREFLEVPAELARPERASEALIKLAPDLAKVEALVLVLQSRETVVNAREAAQLREIERRLQKYLDDEEEAAVMSILF